MNLLGGNAMKKKFNFIENEHAMQALWERESVYTYHPDSDRPIYAIDTPPPTVSGSLHIGHIFSYTQAEMIARFKRMQGFSVFYPFGFDDNGLPTERLVEKELGIRAADMPRSVFTKECLAVSGKYEAEFKALWQSLGFSVDWSLEYRTVSETAQRISQRSFLDLVSKGKAYEKTSPVLWCPHCKTSIAQAELETESQPSQMHTVLFECDGRFLEVATTRPELLYSCVCLFVHPDDTRFKHLVGKTATVPLFGRQVPIYTDSKADPEKGTGIVLCATFGDATDAEWYIEHQLPLILSIQPDGYMAPDIPYIGGMSIRNAREQILKHLAECGLLTESKDILHQVAVHDRCGTSAEILPSRQWYIEILSERERLLAAADAINWYPESMKKRYTAWVENLKWDWCISRQRYFGVPIPVWYCETCGKPVFPNADSLPINPTETEYTGTCSCGGTTFIPETAVFDTWATSSVTPQINGLWGEPNSRDSLFPMTLRTQAHEIIRTWAFYTIVKSLYHMDRLPWQDVMISGFVLAKRGEKISKSKGNASLSPQMLIEKHSADAMRYWAAGSKLGTDTFFSEDALDASKRFMTKLLNAGQFVLMHLEDYNPYEAESLRLLPIDKWMLNRIAEVSAEAEEALNAYETGTARQILDAFFWNDLCDFYIEFVKDRLYKPMIHGKSERTAAQYTLYQALFSTLKFYAPYTPHLTEYFYQLYFRQYEGQSSIHLTAWPERQSPDATLLDFGEAIKDEIAIVRRYKSEHQLSMRADMPPLTISVAPEHYKWFWASRLDFLACTHAESVEFEMK